MERRYVAFSGTKRWNNPAQVTVDRCYVYFGQSFALTYLYLLQHGTETWLLKNYGRTSVIPKGTLGDCNENEETRRMSEEGNEAAIFPHNVPLSGMTRVLNWWLSRGSGWEQNFQRQGKYIGHKVSVFCIKELFLQKSFFSNSVKIVKERDE